MLKHEIIPKSDKLSVASLSENLSTILGFTYRNESTVDRHENILQWCVVDRPGTAQPSPALKKKNRKIIYSCQKANLSKFFEPPENMYIYLPQKSNFCIRLE